MHPQTLTWDTQHTECWATDAAWTGGKYYFYVSAGGGQVGVMVAGPPALCTLIALSGPTLLTTADIGFWSCIASTLGTTSLHPCMGTVSVLGLPLASAHTPHAPRCYCPLSLPTYT